MTPIKRLDAAVAEHSCRILDFDLGCVRLRGRLPSSSPPHPIDEQIAAISLIHDLTVATRNTTDFAGTGARLHDPVA